MLRQIYIYRKRDLLYYRKFGKAIQEKNFDSILDELEGEAFGKNPNEMNSYIYFKYRIAYLTDRELDLIFIFVTGLTDDPENVEKELIRCKKEFLNIFEEIIKKDKGDNLTFQVFDPTTDSIHKKLRPKISLVGFSGVGKTTITRLIKAEEIPMKHIPTITGDIATIKIGKLHFHLWDFAGQEQFSYLWTNFIKGSDAVLLITDSTLENVEKSKFFLELINEQAPNAHTSVIANKQDLDDALNPEEIEEILGLKAYSMIAIDKDNRDKMIKIVADILEMDATISPLLKPLLERDEKMEKAQKALENEKFKIAANLFEEISDLCLDLGDDSLSHEFYIKAQKIKSMLQKAKEKSLKKKIKEVPIEKKPKKEGEIKEKQEFKGEKEIKKKKKLSKPKIKPIPFKDAKNKKPPQGPPEELPPEPPEEIAPEPAEEVAPEAPEEIAPEPAKEVAPEPAKEIEEIQQEEFSEHLAEEETRLELNPEDFMVKKRSKKVSVVPKDAKNKLKTSSFGHVINPEKSASIAKSIEENLKANAETSEIKKKKDKKPVVPISPEIKTSFEAEEPIPSAQIEKQAAEVAAPTKNGAEISSASSLKQKKNLESELMDLRIQKAKISKMLLDFEMKELSGEITEDELKQNTAKLSKMEERLNAQIKELEDLINE